MRRQSRRFGAAHRDERSEQGRWPNGFLLGIGENWLATRKLCFATALQRLYALREGQGLGGGVAVQALAIEDLGALLPRMRFWRSKAIATRRQLLLLNQHLCQEAGESRSK